MVRYLQIVLSYSSVEYPSVSVTLYDCLMGYMCVTTRLLHVGIKIDHAKAMLEQSKDDPKLALQKINHKIMSNTMLGYLYWFQRFDVRICKWCHTVVPLSSSSSLLYLVCMPS